MIIGQQVINQGLERLAEEIAGFSPPLPTEDSWATLTSDSWN